MLTHSTSSENPSTASYLCFCYSFCSLVICTVIPFVSHWCNSSTLHSFVLFSVLLLTIQYLLQWRLFCSSELKHTQVGFCPDLNPPLFRPKSSFSFSSSFFHGRCLWSSVFLLSSFSLKGFLSTYLRKFSASSSSPSSRMPIVLGTFTSSSTKLVDLSYYVQSCRDSMKALQPLVAKNARRCSLICCRWQTKQWMWHAIVFSF